MKEVYSYICLQSAFLTTSGVRNWLN